MTWVDVGADVAAARSAVADAGQLGIAALTVRSDADTSYVSDGDLAMLHVDEEGRLKIASKPASFAVTTGDIVAVAGAVAVDVSRASNVMVHCKGGSVAASAINCTFEASLDSTNGTDGTWFVVQAIRTNANTIETTTGALTLSIGVGNAYGWELSVNACKWFRVRCTARTSGTLTYTIIRGTYATEPIPGGQVSGTQPVSGTVTANQGNWTNPTNYNLVTTASTNAAVIKGSQGTLYEITASNPTATAAYVKIYAKATAPTVGTDIPVLTIPVAAGATVALAFPPIGKRPAAGLAIAVTAAAAATDTGVAVAGVQVNASYT